MTRPASGRWAVVFAAGILFLDGVLLILAGAWTSRVGLIVFGGVLLGAGVGVILLWRRWRRTLRSLDDARGALRRERDALRSLLERTRSRR